MVGRVLLVTLQQALRSVALSLLPITTITLIGWSLAGSQTGNTSDPLRASVWFWLAAHLIPFQLKLAPAFISTFFNYLPIAALIIPFISLRGSYQRAAIELNNERAARSFLTLWYAVIVTLAAYALQSETVKPVVFLAPIYAGALALLACVNWKATNFNKIKFFGFLLLIYFGGIFLLIGISLTLHFSLLKSLILIIEPGWIGGLLFVLLQIIYLPNIVVSLISYFFGIGFSIGSNSIISPLVFKLHGLPAIPILAALPNRKIEFALLGAIPLIFFAILNLVRMVRSTGEIRTKLKNIWSSFWLYIPIALWLGYQSSGTLISKSISPIGAPIWALVSILLGVQLFVTIFFYLLPLGVKRLVTR